jgi:hypothetical protein
MMHTDCTFLLSSMQAAQLSQVCVAYRSYAWQVLSPSAERNQIMRAAQAVQGRLAELRAAGGEPLSFSMTEEERQAVRSMVSTLMQAYAAEPATVERNRLLGDLVLVRTLLERGSRHTQAL